MRPWKMDACISCQARTRSLGSHTSHSDFSLQVTERHFHASDGTFPEIKIGKNLSDVFLTYPELKTWPTVAMPLKAGSASFHSGHLIHGAAANMTPGRRAAMTIQM